jgi:hypothetical protein
VFLCTLENGRDRERDTDADIKEVSYIGFFRPIFSALHYFPSKFPRSFVSAAIFILNPQKYKAELFFFNFYFLFFEKYFFRKTLVFAFLLFISKQKV